MTSNRLYLDHAATAPVLPEARAAMAEALGRWANPSSPHAEGRAARAALETVRGRIADALGWRHDVILTSGASEAIAIAVSRSKLGQTWVGATEHDAVIGAAGGDAQVIPVDESGLADLDCLDGAAALVAIQQVNNETGVIQPLEAIAERVRSSGGLLLADCAQGAGKIALPDADFVAISGHKFGGPPGCGALLVKDIATLTPSGGQERGYRRGTENLPAASGMAAALEARTFVDAMRKLAGLRTELEGALITEGAIVVAGDAPRIATIGSYAALGVPSASQLVQFDLAGIAVSAGSACSSGSMKPSRVLQAMGVPSELTASAIRVSFGPAISADDVERFVAQWRPIAGRAGVRAA